MGGAPSVFGTMDGHSIIFPNGGQIYSPNDPCDNLVKRPTRGPKNFSANASAEFSNLIPIRVEPNFLP